MIQGHIPKWETLELTLKEDSLSDGQAGVFIKEERTAGTNLEPCESRLESASSRPEMTLRKPLLVTGYVPRAGRFDSCLIYIYSFNPQNNAARWLLLLPFPYYR